MIYKIENNVNILRILGKEFVKKKNSNRREKQCGENDDEVYWKWV